MRDIAANVVGADASVGPGGACGVLLPLPEQSLGGQGSGLTGGLNFCPQRSGAEGKTKGLFHCLA